MDVPVSIVAPPVNSPFIHAKIVPTLTIIILPAETKKVPEIGHFLT
jgi:hypothetical protein